MAPILKIALVQLHPQRLDPKRNFGHAEGFIRQAASKGAHLAVLPEYHLTSWAPHDEGFAACCRESAPVYLEKYQSLARELGIAIVPGTLVEARGDDTAGDKDDDLVNVAYWIDRRGEVAGRYKKKNLWHDERPHLTGDPSRHEAFDTALLASRTDGEREELSVRVGMLVCWDLAFPEAMRELVRDGARVVVAPAFWLADQYRDGGGRVVNGDSERVFLDTVVVARACESSAAVVFVNAGGPKEGGQGDGQAGTAKYCGVSQVGMPLIGSVGRLGAEEGMSVVDIDLEVLDVAEKGYKVRADLAREGWHYGYSLVKEQEDSEGEGDEAV